MKKFLQDILWIGICLVVWIILFESLEIKIILSGLVFSTLALLFTEKYLIGGHFYDYYPVNLIWLIRYFVYLVYEIYMAGIETMILIYTGKINPGVVEVETSLESSFKRSILANSITLTPGTVTLDMSEKSLTVLWIDVQSRDSKKAGDLIKGRMERRLM